MGKAEWGGTSVCWWLGLYFCLVCCLDDASGTGCYWWLGDARSCIQVVSFVWVLTIWYPLGLVLWQSRVLESVLPLQRLRVWSLGRNEDSTNGLLWHWGRVKQISENKKPKMNPQANGSYKIRQIIIKIIEYTHIHIHPWVKWKHSNKNKVQ